MTKKESFEHNNYLTLKNNRINKYAFLILRFDENFFDLDYL